MSVKQVNLFSEEDVEIPLEEVITLEACLCIRVMFGRVVRLLRPETVLHVMTDQPGLLLNLMLCVFLCLPLLPPLQHPHQHPNSEPAVLPALPGIHKKIVVSQQRVEKDNSTVQLRKNVSLVVPPVKQLSVTMMESVAGKRAVSVLTV